MNKKPLLTISEQIEHLKAKGITFSLMSEQAAADYLENHTTISNLLPIARIFQNTPPAKSPGNTFALISDSWLILQSLIWNYGIHFYTSLLM